VIGVFDRKSGRQYNNTNRPENRLVLVPQTTAERARPSQGRGPAVIVTRARAESEVALRAVLASLARRGDFHPDDTDAVHLRFSRCSASSTSSTSSSWASSAWPAR
jgi:hypothetical protein